MHRYFLTSELCFLETTLHLLRISFPNRGVIAEVAENDEEKLLLVAIFGTNQASLTNLVYGFLNVAYNDRFPSLMPCLGEIFHQDMYEKLTRIN